MKRRQKSALGFLVAAMFSVSLAYAVGCGDLTLNAGRTVQGYVTDQYVWYDSGCRLRSAALVRSNVKGGHAKQFTYQLPDGTIRTINESPVAGGFGYIVSHLRDADIAGRHGEDDSPLGSNLNANYRTVFAGKHHAIHEFTTNYPRWGIDPATGADTKYDMPVTVHWLFATGRDHPLWAVTFDLTAAPANAVDADTRAPYGDMLFDGAPAGTWGDDAGGVAWGESYRFTTTGTPFNLNTAWDWSARNGWAPYNMLWTRNVDAEMGIAGTLVNSRQDAGGYQGGDGRGFSSASASLTCQDYGYTMPCDWRWPFQSVNYSFDPADPAATTNSKRLAWGADWGYLGQDTITTINGNMVHGWPKVSYSTYIVLGPHATGPTLAMAQQAAAVDATTLTTTAGYVVMQGPAGVNRSDMVTYVPAGLNPVYGSWEVWTDNGRATLNFSVSGGSPLVNPLIVLRSYWGSATPNITLSGVALQPDVDYFATYRDNTHELWLTLNRSLSGSQTLAVSN